MCLSSHVPIPFGCRQGSLTGNLSDLHKRRHNNMQHGNTKRLPHNALTYEDIIRIVKFLSNYAEEQAILLPGRVPGYKRDDFKLLPSKKVHSEYKKEPTKFNFLLYSKYGDCTAIPTQ